MIRVSRNVAGTSSPFKQDSSVEYHRTRNRKRFVFKCNGQLELEQQPTDLSQSSPLRSSRAIQKFSQSKPINIIRTSPLKEIQSNSVAKVHDSSGQSEIEMNLFAGSKSYVTPSPSELPKPPKNWMNADFLQPKLEMPISILEDIDQDSAILGVGIGSDNTLASMKSRTQN